MQRGQVWRGDQQDPIRGVHERYGVVIQMASGINHDDIKSRARRLYHAEQVVGSDSLAHAQLGRTEQQVDAGCMLTDHLIS